MKDVKYISAHQPAFMPWLGYIHRISLSNIFIILDDVQFEKNSFTNRNKILNKSLNKTQWLTVPILIKGHLEKKIKDIKINNQINWKKKHLAKLAQEYGKTKQFETRFNDFCQIYKQDHSSLLGLNMEILSYFLKSFSINTTLFKQSDLKITGKNNEIIVAICKKFNIENFIFGLQGKNYINSKLFKSKNIYPFEHRFNCLHSNKITNDRDVLSSIDLIFRYSDNELKNYLKLSALNNNLTRISEE